MLVNDKWLDIYPKSYCVFEVGGCSDHIRGRVHLDAEENGKRKPFKFVNVLAKLPQFVSVVGDYWEQTNPLYISTSETLKEIESFEVDVANTR